MAKASAGPRVERSEKYVRTYLAGQLVAATKSPLLVWDPPTPLVYYFPIDDVRDTFLVLSETEGASPSQGPARYFDVVVGDTVANDAACVYPESPNEALRDRLFFDWHAMGSWFEEDEEVFFRPRDPHHRVEVIASSRHVRVVIDDVTIAESRHGKVLFETGLPPRFYLPLVDVRMDLLSPSPTSSRCPYKGVASYWNINVGAKTYEDLVWSYKSPLFESIGVAGLACFWNEKLDLYVDGALDERSFARHTDT